MSRIHQLTLSKEVVESKQPIKTVRLKLVASVKEPIKQEKPEVTCLGRHEKFHTPTPENKVTLSNEIFVDTELSQKAINKETAILEEIMKVDQLVAPDWLIKMAEEKEPEAEKVTVPISEQGKETSEEESSTGNDTSHTNEPEQNETAEIIKSGNIITASPKSASGHHLSHQNGRNINPQSLQQHKTDVDVKTLSYMKETAQKCKSHGNVTCYQETNNGTSKANQHITGAIPKLGNAKKILTMQFSMKENGTQSEVIECGKSPCHITDILNRNKCYQGEKSDQTLTEDQSRQELGTSKRSVIRSNQAYTKTADQRQKPFITTTGLCQSTMPEKFAQMAEPKTFKSQYTTRRYEIKSQLEQASGPLQTNQTTYKHYNTTQNSQSILPTIQKADYNPMKPFVASPIMTNAAQTFVVYNQLLKYNFRPETSRRIPMTRVIEPITSVRSYFEPEPVSNRSGMLIYCLKCRRKTNTGDSFETVTMKGQPIMKGCCVICDRKKCCFLKRH